MTRLWTARPAPWIALCLAAVAVVAVGLVVDLAPRVEGEFFFAEDDPQMRATEEVARRFPAGSQLVVRVEDRSGDPSAHRERLGALTVALLAVDGVRGGYSATTTDAVRSPLFRRIIATPDPAATNVVLQVDDTDPEILLPRVEAVVDAHRVPGLDVVVSGVPAIVELIRRSLQRDLVVFSAAAFIVFGLLIGLVFRDGAVVVGTLATCTLSVALTLLVVQRAGVGIGLLTANLVTIVFVLTLSHVVFLTANWRRGGGSSGGGAGSSEGGAGSRDGRARLERTLRDTWEGSFWSMTTTLLGFASLLVATARPLRELGVAGIVGAATALIVAYLAYPAFLGAWAKVPVVSAPSGGAMSRPGARWIVPVTVAVVAVVAVGVTRVDTDPGLLSYFAEGSELHDGLARIDADGGSSTLDIVVRDPAGAPVTTPAVYARLEVVQAALDADPAVGTALSPVVLVEHARTIPFAGLLPPSRLLDLAASPALGGVGLGFVTPQRDEARFSLRMRETVEEPREVVTRRLTGLVDDAGLEPVVVAGLYVLQAELARLIASSLRIGIGGLLALFLGVAVVVARRARVAGAMWLCLAAIPTVILGVFGWSGAAIDIITSPSANIALALGADSLVHLVVRVRRLGATAAPWSELAWAEGVRQIGPAVLGASAIVCAGFGIFALSSFPPTARFGLAVIVGTVTAATMALAVLPRLACPGWGRADSLSGP